MVMIVTSPWYGTWVCGVHNLPFMNANNLFLRFCICLLNLQESQGSHVSRESMPLVVYGVAYERAAEKKNISRSKRIPLDRLNDTQNDLYRVDNRNDEESMVRCYNL